jgi:hypothetical protein
MFVISQDGAKQAYPGAIGFAQHNPISQTRNYLFCSEDSPLAKKEDGVLGLSLALS